MIVRSLVGLRGAVVPMTTRVLAAVLAAMVTPGAFLILDSFVWQGEMPQAESVVLAVLALPLVASALILPLASRSTRLSTT